MNRMRLINGDCLKEMDNLISEGVKVDAIITDPPYGTTACKWDSVIPFDAMWERLNKLIKPNGAIVLFGSEPFSSALRMSNIKNYKYDWIWDKVRPSNFFQAKYTPLNNTENICVFSNGGVNNGSKIKAVYNPQGIIKINKIVKNSNSVGGKVGDAHKTSMKRGDNYTQEATNYPMKRIIYLRDKTCLHPTQKPVSLMEYLIKTYTNEGETVLDFTMGSGTTGVACKNTNRHFIGIELDTDYFNIAKDRINSTEQSLFSQEH